MKKVKLSEYVKNLRSESKLTVNEFAKLYNLSHTQINKYESGQLDDPTVLVVSKFCKKFGLTSKEFFKLIDVPRKFIGLDNGESIETSIEVLMNAKPKKSILNDISDCFCGHNSNIPSLSFLRGCYNQPSEEFMEIHFDAEADSKNGENVYIAYFPYKKIQKGKTAFKFYHDINDAISSLYLSKQTTYKNIVLMTPSYAAYEYFAKREYRQVYNLNIIILYYKYRRDREYKVICGKDFLKD